MPTISNSVKVEVEVTPHDLGVIFAKMDSREQAEFFEGIADEVATWAKAACFQWQALADNLEAFPRAREVFQGMAEYASQ